MQLVANLHRELHTGATRKSCKHFPTRLLLVFPHTIPYSNTLSPIYPQFQFHYFPPPPDIAPVTPQVIPSPSKGRKRKSNATGRGGGGSKRQRVPAPIVAAPTSTICGVGPTVPVTSLLSDNVRGSFHRAKKHVLSGEVLYQQGCLRFSKS